MELSEILNITFNDLDTIGEIAKCIERGDGDHVALSRAIVFMSVGSMERIEECKSSLTGGLHG